MLTVDDEDVETLDSLLERLSVPASRVLFRPPPGTATEADVLRFLDAPRKRICELVDGVLIEKPMGAKEAILASELQSLIWQWVRPRKLGFLTGEGGPFRMDNGRIRFPDVAYVPWTRFDPATNGQQAILDVAPALAVEVLSLSNTFAEMETKLEEYFTVGVLCVWMVDPELRTVTAYNAPSNAIVYRAGQQVPGAPALPGFDLDIDDWFGILDHFTGR